MYSFNNYFEKALEKENFFWDKNRAEVEALLIDSSCAKIAIHRDYRNPFSEYISGLIGQVPLFCFSVLERNARIFNDGGTGSPIGRFTLVLNGVVQARFHFNPMFFFYFYWEGRHQTNPIRHFRSRLCIAQVSFLKVMAKAWADELLLSPVDVLLKIFFHTIDRSENLIKKF